MLLQLFCSFHEMRMPFTLACSSLSVILMLRGRTSKEFHVKITNAEVSAAFTSGYFYHLVLVLVLFIKILKLWPQKEG